MIYKALKTVSSLVAVNAMAALTAMLTIAPNPPPVDDKSNLGRLIAMGIPRNVAKNALEQAHDNLPMASGILMEQLRRDVFIPTRVARMADEDKVLGKKVLRQSKKENAKYKRYTSDMRKTLTVSRPKTTTKRTPAKRAPMTKRVPAARSTPKKVTTRRGDTHRQVVSRPQSNNAGNYRLITYAQKLKAFPEDGRVLKKALLAIQAKPPAKRTNHDLDFNQPMFQGAPYAISCILNTLKDRPDLVNQAILALQEHA
jgi:hypothetical protein